MDSVTQLPSDGVSATDEPSEGTGDLDRPALDDAHIRIRPDGRQLVIDRGGRPEPEDEEGPGEGSDGPTPEADGVDLATRGEITEFSEDSRRRVRSLLHSLRRSGDVQLLFVTLTYHQERPGPERAERDLDVFWKRLRRRLPHLSMVWKKEPQKRGVPHFHLILVGTKFIPAQWLSQLWHDVTKETTEQHRKSGVDIEPVWGNQDGKLQAYLSEYLSEEAEGKWPESGGEEWKTPGRFWGVRGRENLPVAPWAEWAVYLDHGDAAQLIRDLLDQWDTDLPDGVLPPTLTLNTRGDPEEAMQSLLDRL